MAKTPQMQAAVDSLARALFGRDSSDTRTCVTCGQPSGEFRDDLSWKEFTISGMCQKCQDSVFAK